MLLEDKCETSPTSPGNLLIEATRGGAAVPLAPKATKVKDRRGTILPLVEGKEEPSRINSGLPLGEGQKVERDLFHDTGG